MVIEVVGMKIMIYGMKEKIYSRGKSWHMMVILICHPYTVQCQTCGLYFSNQPSTERPSVFVYGPLIYRLVESGSGHENRTE